MSNRFLYFALAGVFVLSGRSLQAQEQTREILPEQINSPYIEIRPFISGDGQTLYFSRREHPENFNGEKDMQDIWMVKRNGDEWGNPENLGKTINNKFANSLCSVSPDGQEMLVFNTYKRIDGPLARFRKDGNSWGKPEPVIIRNYQNYNQFLDFFQSYTENVLFLAIETKDSRGEQDLYVSFDDGQGGWREPLNLGPDINTAKSEFAPFLAADGKTLFFSSYGRKGQGGADIYYAQRLDDSWQKWTVPVNLGTPINSRGEETYCSVTDDMSSIYYVSYQHGSEMRDIIKSELPESLSTQPQPMLTETAAEEMLAADTQSTGRAQNADKNAETSSVTPKTEQEAQHQQQSVSVGEPVEFSLARKEIPSDIPNMRQYAVLRNIYFEFNQLDLKKGTYDSMLQALASYVKQQPGAKVRLVGHSDELGTAGGNLKTSKLRAQSVKNYLLAQGLPKADVLVEYKGETEPLASNDDDREGRELNRRVEIFVLLPDSQ